MVFFISLIIIICLLYPSIHPFINPFLGSPGGLEPIPPVKVFDSIQFYLQYITQNENNSNLKVLYLEGKDPPIIEGKR